MIFQASMVNGKRSAKLWLVGRRFDGGLTRWQEWTAHLTLQRLTKSDDINFSSIKERLPNGTLEIVCCGNCY